MLLKERMLLLHELSSARPLRAGCTLRYAGHARAHHP